MEMQDWAHVTQGINAIGQTVDRRNQNATTNARNEKIDAEADRQREINTQTATAYNFFMKNPNAWDFDNPEKQPQPTAMDGAAGITPKPKPLPIEGYHPEAIAAARIQAMRSYTDKKQLSRENLTLHVEQGKLDAQNFKKGIGQAMTVFASGDELTTKQMIAETYNAYYKDAHSMEVDESGEMWMVSPTGKRKQIENPDLKTMLEKLGTITDADHIKASISRERTLTDLNNQALMTPGLFRDKRSNKLVYQYNVINKQTNKTEPMYSLQPYGVPGWQSMTEEQFRGMSLEPVGKSGTGALDDAAGEASAEWDKGWIKYVSMLEKENAAFGREADIKEARKRYTEIAGQRPEAGGQSGGEVSKEEAMAASERNFHEAAKKWPHLKDKFAKEFTERWGRPPTAQDAAPAAATAQAAGGEQPTDHVEPGPEAVVPATEAAGIGPTVKNAAALEPAEEPQADEAPETEPEGENPYGNALEGAEQARETAKGILAKLAQYKGIGNRKDAIAFFKDVKGWLLDLESQLEASGKARRGRIEADIAKVKAALKKAMARPAGKDYDDDAKRRWRNQD